MAFIDVAKAYDTVWLDGLWWTLHRKGVCGPVWRLLKNWYASTTSCVTVEGAITNPFPVLQGVKQGGVLSPLLYIVFINGLFERMAQHNLGISILQPPTYTGTLLYADDMAFCEHSPQSPPTNTGCPVVICL